MERSVKEMMTFLNLRHRETFMASYIYPLLKDNLLEMTLPGKRKSPKQKYRITATGLSALEDVLGKSLEER